MEMSEQINELAAALAKAQGQDDRWEESALIRKLCRVPMKAGRQHSKRPLVNRILALVAFGATDCWHWTGRVNRAGYGRMTFAGVDQPAHRLSYMAFVGPVSAGTFVLHKCDNPTCVNPDHLFLGGYSENRVDCLNKGRWSPKPKRGYENACAVYTEVDFERMQDLRRRGYAYAVIASHLGFGTMVVWNALNRRGQ